ncbi:MAG: isocitrate/isopropylmalate family dehydrogenase, partial [Chloroflexota bacterium]|nr:isocitrate/isopropylmalate family dehydrogenase [Chloroflexota bacterium]
GIGPEVTNESVKVLNAIGDRFGHTFSYEHGAVGGNAIDDYGNALPDSTLRTAKAADAVLFGAVGGPKWDDPRAKTRPEDGLLAIRQGLDLFANLRPVQVVPQLIDASTLKPSVLEGVDFVVVRELTGGLYYGKPKKRWSNSRGRRGVDTMYYSEEFISRVLRVGFELARMRRKKLTSVDKANVLESSRLWREIAMEMGQEYPDVELEHVLVDTAA